MKPSQEELQKRDLRVTACECEQPGYCQRHQCEKTETLFNQCRYSQSTFKRMEQGDYPPRGKKQPNVDTCIHRGEEVDRIECSTCRGSIQVKVFACSEFEQCTFIKQVNEITVCQSCDLLTPLTELSQ